MDTNPAESLAPETDPSTSTTETPDPALQALTTKQLLILWSVFTSRPDFLNAPENGGLGPADLTKIATTIGLPEKFVTDAFTKASQNPKFSAVGSEFQAYADDAPYDCGLLCPGSLDAVLALTSGLQTTAA